MAFVSKELIQKVRTEIKTAYPAKHGFKFSITNRHSSTIVVTVLKTPFELDEKGSINQYHHEKTKNISSLFLADLLTIINQDNYNRSDIMTDYHYVGYYCDLSVGRWDKEFIFKETKFTKKYIDKFNSEIEEIKKQEAKQAKEYEEKRKKEDAEYKEYQAYEKIRLEEKEKLFKDVKIRKCNDKNNVYKYAFSPKINKNDILDLVTEQLEDKNEYSIIKVQVTHTLSLNDQQYNFFINNLLDKHDFLDELGGCAIYDNNEINAGQELENYETGYRCLCILVFNTKTNAYILVDPQGHNYARYVYIHLENENFAQAEAKNKEIKTEKLAELQNPKITASLKVEKSEQYEAQQITETILTDVESRLKTLIEYHKISPDYIFNSSKLGKVTVKEFIKNMNALSKAKPTEILPIVDFIESLNSKILILGYLSNMLKEI